jgi:hypothetical protein
MVPPPLTMTADTKDAEQLKLLATFHYVLAAVGALFACLPLLHVGLGIMMITRPDWMTNGHKASAPPAFFGYFIVAMAAFFILLGWTMAVCTFLSGRYLNQRRRRTFSFVVAAILCVFMPLGTVLGVFTLVVLSKESVIKLYAETPRSE